MERAAEGTHRDDFELHQGADATLGERQHGLNLGALLGTELREHRFDALLRQVLN